MSGKGTALLLVAAGLSSRMGAFKPLIVLGEKPLIGHALDAFKTAGITETVVVTGFQSEAIEEQLKGRGIVFIRNERYAETEMFDSVKLGLRYLMGRCGSVFTMPADIPLVKPFCIEEMLASMQAEPSGVLKPTYGGKSGHPLLIGAACIPYILGYTGGNGLKGALASGGFPVRALSLPDPGILMDADTPEGLALIRDHYNTMDIPPAGLAMEILAWRDAGEAITAHSLEVARLAGKLALRALSRDYPVSLRLVEAGALLHDVERKSGGDHAEKGSALLFKMGYPKVAAIAGAHMDLPLEAIERMDVRAVVYLADKLVCGTERVTLKVRLDRALSKFGYDDEAVKSINKRMADARAVMERLGLNDAACLEL